MAFLYISGRPDGTGSGERLIPLEGTPHKHAPRRKFRLFWVQTPRIASSKSSGSWCSWSGANRLTPRTPSGKFNAWMQRLKGRCGRPPTAADSTSPSRPPFTLLERTRTFLLRRSALNECAPGRAGWKSAADRVHCRSTPLRSVATSLHATSTRWRLPQLELTSRLWVLEGEFTKEDRVPQPDGTPEQWGGDRLYDVVVWNTPYLPSTVLQDGALGPMEEAALVDTDAQGLVQRLFSSVSAGRLLTQTGVAFLTVSSVGFADRAQTWAWLGGLAARTVATMRFEDGESLSVLAVWRPFSQAQIVHLPVVNSTNDELLNGDAPIGTTVRTNEQTAGRGRRGRTWTNQPGAMMASWLVGVDAGSNHRTIDQLRVGEGLQRMIRAWSTLPPDRIQLKWPNDLYTCSEGGRPQKAGGVLFEGATKGSHHRIVLGLGLNLQNALTTEFGSLTDVGVSIDAARVHSCVHGMVASLFEDVAGVPHRDRGW